MEKIGRISFPPNEEKGNLFLLNEYPRKLMLNKHEVNVGKYYKLSNSLTQNLRNMLS